MVAKLTPPTCMATRLCKFLYIVFQNILSILFFPWCDPRHTAGRRDNFECVLLLITRGSRLDLRNKENQLALEVCPDKRCHSALLLALNMKLQQFTQTPSSDCEKLLSKYRKLYLLKLDIFYIIPGFYSDITKGKETNPIQCVNGFDNETKPEDFIYITENCFTSPLHVDKTINSLTVLDQVDSSWEFGN